MQRAQFWTDDARLIPFLPMVYIAWADGDLSRDEVSEIRELARTSGALDEGSADQLAAMLDPGAPPSARELGQMLRHIREHASELAQTERRTLLDLGAELARVDGADPQPVRDALGALEDALGVGAGETAALFTDERAPAIAPDCYEHEEEAAFDVGAMAKRLDGERSAIRAKIRAILSEPQFRYPDPGIETGAYRELVLSWLRSIADHGIGRLAYPKYTKEAPDMGDFLAAFETLGFFDLSLVIKFGVQFGLYGGSIYFLGTERHHERYLDRAASVEEPGCFAMTELGHGSNVRGLLTTATYDADAAEWIIDTPEESARKEWIGNAACHARYATVFAQLITQDESHGVHAFVVPIRDEQGREVPGVTIGDCGHKLGLNGVDNGRIWFDQVRVPAENLLDRFASVSQEGAYQSPIASEGKRFFTTLGTLVGGRISVGAAALSAAKSALAIAVRYGAMRRQFGPAGAAEIAILDYRTHQRRLMPLLANAYALNFALHYLSDRFVGRSEEDVRDIETLAAGFKAWSTWNTTETVQTARECCGGQGYLSVNRFAALKADSDIFTTFEGDNTVLMQLVAKSLLSEYGRQFNDLSFFTILRFVADQASAQLRELDPVTTRRTDSAHLRDRSWHAEMFAHRERMLVASVARRFKSRTDDGLDSFQAMIEVQDHLMATAKAHMDRVIWERFDEAVEASQEPEERAALHTLRELFGLYQIERDIGWFMENGIVEAAKAKAIRSEVNALCAEARAQAVHYVDAFAIPDTCLAAPIAFSPIVEPGQTNRS